jgi:hypothetical protein
VASWAKRHGIVLKKRAPAEKLLRSDVTQAMLLEAYTYDPLTGRLTCRTSKWTKKQPGAEACYLNRGLRGQPRRELIYRGVHIKATRAIWMMVHGSWPEGDIDHINGDAQDDRLCNLRDVPRHVNAQNTRVARSTNKLGLLGVYRHNNGIRPFLARIQLPSGQTKRIGYFETAEAAHAAYVEAKRQFHEGCTL